jgi:hypothetical protein
MRRRRGRANAVLDDGEATSHNDHDCLYRQRGRLKINQTRLAQKFIRIIERLMMESSKSN